MVGSLSGTSPGFAFDAVSVPLNFDRYLSIIAGNPGLPPLAGAFGTLDASGRATAAFTLAAGIAPSLAGLNAHHVFGVFDLTALLFVSNPVVVEFVP